LNAIPADRVSPFRLRLRIALTTAGAIEGEGGRGGPLLSSLSEAPYRNAYDITAGRRRPITRRAAADTIGCGRRPRWEIRGLILFVWLRPKAALVNAEPNTGFRFQKHQKD
jgi:hypothetical protein